MTSIIGINMLAGGIPTLTPVDGFPNGEAGIDQGVSACFAGGFNDFIVMAGADPIALLGRAKAWRLQLPGEYACPGQQETFL